jgi:hypothetical protein
MLKQSLILGAKAVKGRQTKVKQTKLGGGMSLRNEMVAIAYNVYGLAMLPITAVD